MLRKTGLLVAVLAVMAVAQAQAAKGEWNIGLNAGTGIPMSDYKDLAKLGFMGGVGFDYMATENFALGVDGSFTSNSGSDDLEALATIAAGTPTTAKFTLLQGGAHARYLFPMASESSISPYILGGVGIYNVKGKYEGSNTTFNTANETSDSKLGVRGGLGLMYKTSEKVGIGVEGAFHWINTKDDATGAPATQFIGLQAAVSIGMGNPSSK
jgi:opacity protein-like surface antigen